MRRDIHQNQLTKTANELLQRLGSGQATLNRRAAARALLLSDDSYATVLITLALDTYGYEMLGWNETEQQWDEPWHPETVKRQLEEDFGLELPKVSLDKLMSAVVLLTTNYFFKDVSRFIELCNILAGDDFQPDEFDPADAGEIMWGVTEAMLLWPADDDDPEDTRFSAEIREYISQQLQQEGILDPPDVLRLGSGADPADAIPDEFAEDPEMYSAMWQVQDQKRHELTQMVKDNLKELAFQLSILPLKRGDAGSLIKQIEEISGAISTTEV